MKGLKCLQRSQERGDLSPRKLLQIWPHRHLSLPTHPRQKLVPSPGTTGDFKVRLQNLRPWCYLELPYFPTLFGERQLCLALGEVESVPQSRNPAVVALNPSTVLRQNQQCKRNVGRRHIFRDSPPDTCQQLHQLVILTEGHLPLQLLPVASTLGAQGPGCFKGSQISDWVKVVTLGSISPSFYYSSSALYIWG